MGRGDSGEDDKARELALGDAIDDLAQAVTSGQGVTDEIGASIAQVRQLSKNVDLIEMRERINIPDDAGEWADGLVKIMQRIPDGWGRWIRCSRGWYPIIVELDEQLSKLVPDYHVHQVKEKFGGLNFYYELPDGPLSAITDDVRALVRSFEARASTVCESCGDAGQLCKTRAASPWYRTLCAECAANPTRGNVYLSAEEWDVWWEEERPRHLERRKANFLEGQKGKRIMVASSNDDLRFDFEATYVVDAAVVREQVLANDWDEIWLDDDDAGAAVVTALAERYRGHHKQQDEAKASHFASARAEGKQIISFPLRPPEGAPALIKLTRVSLEAIDGYGIHDRAMPDFLREA